MANIGKVINDLQDAVNDDWMWQHADYYALTMERAIALLKNQQAEIERLKEKHPKNGQWQPYEYGDKTWHKCSVCGVADRYIDVVKRENFGTHLLVRVRNFCPNCGADMRTKKKQKNDD